MFRTHFWDFDRSRYVQGRLARSGTISRAYCQCMTLMVGKYMKPYFDGRRVSALTAEGFHEWMAELAADEVPARTIGQSIWPARA